MKKVDAAGKEGGKEASRKKGTFEKHIAQGADIRSYLWSQGIEPNPGPNRYGAKKKTEKGGETIMDKNDDKTPVYIPRSAE